MLNYICHYWAQLTKPEYSNTAELKFLFISRRKYKVQNHNYEQEQIMFEILGCEAMARKSSHDKCCRNMTVYFDNNYDEELAERQQLTECDQ